MVKKKNKHYSYKLLEPKCNKDKKKIIMKTSNKPNKSQLNMNKSKIN